MSMIPDFFQPLIAWRKFEFWRDGKILTSAGHTAHWWPTADLGEAVCRNDGAVAYDIQTDSPVYHDAPQLNCTCGFYCYKERADAEQHGQGHVLARVEVWGRLAEHRRGYRAQYMRMLELFVAPGCPTIAALEKRYRVPVAVDQGASKWISENHFASSLSSQLASQISNNLLNTIQQFYPQPPSYQPPNQYQQGLAQFVQMQTNYNAMLQNASAAQQYHAAYKAMAAQAMAPTPKAPFVVRADVLYGTGVVKPAPLQITAAAPAPADAKDAEIVEDFDPVAERVTKRLNRQQR